MIAPLRRRHRNLALLLLVLLPALALLALSQRPSFPRVAVPPQLGGQAQTGEALENAVSGAFAEVPLAWSAGRSAEGAASLLVEAEGPIEVPDLLLYWSAEPGQQPDRPPAAAVLLGRVAVQGSRSYSLPANRSGHLSLFSLAHQQLVDSAAVPAVEGSEPAVEGAEPAEPSGTAAAEQGPELGEEPGDEAASAPAGDDES